MDNQNAACKSCLFTWDLLKVDLSLKLVGISKVCEHSTMKKQSLVSWNCKSA